MRTLQTILARAVVCATLLLCGARCVAQAAAATALPATDVFVGRGVVGPYFLAWRNIEPASETVLRNGVRLVRGDDYDLNETVGVLTFRAALTSRDIARIDYRYLPGKASVNSSVVAIPFGFRLLDDPRGALSLSAVFRPDLAPKQGAPASGPSAMQLGFDGSYRAGKTSEFSGKLALDARFGDLAARSGFLLRDQTAFRGGKIDLSLTRAGSEFALTDQTGIAAGKQTLQGVLDLTPLPSWRTSLAYSQTTDLPASGAGATVTTLTQKVTGTVDARTRLQASHTSIATASPGAPPSSSETSRVQVDRTLDARTGVTALFSRSETDGPAGVSIVQSQSLDLRSRPATWLSIAGRYQNRLTPDGAEDLGQFQLAAQAGRRARVSASMADKLAAAGGLHTREASLEYAPAGNLTLTSGFALRSEGTQESSTQSLGATWKPGTLEIGGNVRLREAAVGGRPQPDAPDTYDVRLAVGLGRTPLRLTGSWAENPEDAGGSVQRVTRQGMGIRTTLGRLDLSSDYLRQFDPLGQRTEETLRWQLAYSLRKGTRITGEYSDSVSRDTAQAASDSLTLALTHQVGSAIDLTLCAGYTRHAIDGLLQPDSEYRAETKLRLRF